MLFSWGRKKRNKNNPEIERSIVLEREKREVHVLANELIVKEELAKNIKEIVLSSRLILIA